MGIARLALDLPRGLSPDEAIDQAATELRDQHIGWTTLEFHTTLTSSESGMYRFAFTYRPTEDEPARN